MSNYNTYLENDIIRNRYRTKDVFIRSVYRSMLINSAGLMRAIYPSPNPWVFRDFATPIPRGFRVLRRRKSGGIPCCKINFSRLKSYCKNNFNISTYKKQKHIQVIQANVTSMSSGVARILCQGGGGTGLAS